MGRVRFFAFAFVSFCFILLGIFVLFKVTWSKDADSFLGLAGYALVVGSAYFFTMFLYKFLLPANFGFNAMGGNKNLPEMKKQYGAGKMRMLFVGFFAVFLLVVAAAGYLYYVLVKRYEERQLGDYGQLQKVRIKKIDYKGKGSPYAFFDFTFNGDTISEELSRKGLNEGDSAVIIFSTQDVRVVKWAEDFR